MVLPLQGCMAVGKTTALNYLRENAPYVNVSYEENSEVVQAIRNRKLDKNKSKTTLRFRGYGWTTRSDDSSESRISPAL